MATAKKTAPKAEKTAEKTIEKTAATVAKKPTKAASAPKVKPVAAKKPAVKAATSKKPAAATVSPAQRSNYVEIAAYYIAERRGFTPGDPLADWAEAEAEIDRLLATGRLGV
jgi:hypothetical protein